MNSNRQRCKIQDKYFVQTVPSDKTRRRGVRQQTTWPRANDNLENLEEAWTKRKEG